MDKNLHKWWWRWWWWWWWCWWWWWWCWRWRGRARPRPRQRQRQQFQYEDNNSKTKRLQKKNVGIKNRSKEHKLSLYNCISLSLLLPIVVLLPLVLPPFIEHLPWAKQQSPGHSSSSSDSSFQCHQQNSEGPLSKVFTFFKVSGFIQKQITKKAVKQLRSFLYPLQSLRHSCFGEWAASFGGWNFTAKWVCRSPSVPNSNWKSRCTMQAMQYSRRGARKLNRHSGQRYSWLSDLRGAAVRKVNVIPWWSDTVNLMRHKKLCIRH